MLTKESRRTFIRRTIATVSASALASYGTGRSAVAQTAPAAGVSSNTPFVISPSTLASIVARPETFLLEYQALGGGSATDAAAAIRTALGAAFATISDTGCMAVYASVIAFNVAPQGNPGFSAMDASLSQLLNATLLSCEHFCKLATMLAFLGRATLGPPDLSNQTNSPPATIHFILWLDSVPLDSGYHSQLVISNALTNAYLLLDPTYAFALAIPFGPSGPQSNLTDIENAATFLEQPLGAENLVVFDAASQQVNPTAIQFMTSGSLGPQYIYHDPNSGSEAWNARIGQIIGNMN